MQQYKKRNYKYLIYTPILALVLSGIIYTDLNSKPTAKNLNEPPTSVTPESQTQTAESSQTSQTTVSDQSSDVVIDYDQYGFDPNILSVPIGTTVSVQNISNQVLKFAPLYGAGQDNRTIDLALGNIAPGQSKSFNVTSNGVWQYEGQHEPEVRGIIKTGPLTSDLASLDINPPVINQAVVVKYDDYGFEPNEIKVPSDTNVSIYNVASGTQPGPMKVLEAPGQAKNSDLSFGLISKLQTKSMVITNKGIWRYDDVYQPSPKCFGQITVN